MGFLKTLFGGDDLSPEEKKEREEARQFDVFKSDGVRAMRMGQVDYAEKCFRRALEIKDDLEIHDYLSQVLVHQEKFDEGFDHLKLLAEAQPDNIHILITMAHVAYMKEDYTTMAEICEKAMLLDKDNAQVLFLYARCSQGQHDLVNAVAMLTKTIMLDESFAAAYLERGEILLGMGDVEGASEDADHLMEIADGAEDVLLFKSRVLMAQGQFAQAIDVLDRAIEGNPFCTAALKARGTCRLALGDKDGAERDMRQVLDIDPDALSDVSGEFSAEGKD